MYVSNNARTMTTTVGRFALEQRNVGFFPNDGKWIASQYPELYWSSIGTLRRRRAGRFLGVFATEADALAAIEAADLMPEIDEAVLSMGRTSS